MSEVDRGVEWAIASEFTELNTDLLYKKTVKE